MSDSPEQALICAARGLPECTARAPRELDGGPLDETPEHDGKRKAREDGDARLRKPSVTPAAGITTSSPPITTEWVR